MTQPDDLVIDPFFGVGTTGVAAIRHGRRVAGAEIQTDYADIAKQRLELEWRGELRTRPMGRPVYQPTEKDKVAQNPYSNLGQ